jgi:antitoxin YefM
MYTEFHLKAAELDMNFLQKIKKMFGNKAISIIIEEEPDETEYLFRSEENKKMLLESKRQAEAGELIKIELLRKDFRMV